MNRGIRIACAALGVLVSTVFFSGCCTVIHGTRQDIAVYSYPSGADVRVNGELKGMTPLRLNLKRNKTFVITIEKQGYEPYERTLTRKANFLLIGTILMGGMSCLVVDALTGAMYVFDPDDIRAELDRIGGAEAGQDRDAPDSSEDPDARSGREPPAGD